MQPVRSIKNQYHGINAHLHSHWQSVGGWNSFHSNHIADLLRLLRAKLLPMGYTAEIEPSLQIRRLDAPAGEPESDITIFDPTGNIKKESKTLEQCVDKRKELFFGNSTSSYRFQVGIPQKDHAIHRPEPNSARSLTRLSPFRVTLLSHEEGRWAFLQFARDFCAQKTFTNEDLTEDFIQVNLLVGSQVDPDLILSCGNVHSLRGFLPWHIRLSEIFFLNTLRNINSSSFVEALKHYSKVVQRHGT